MGAPINSCVLGNITGRNSTAAMIVDIGSEVQKRPFVEAVESCKNVATEALITNKPTD